MAIGAGEPCCWQVNDCCSGAAAGCWSSVLAVDFLAADDNLAGVGCVWRLSWQCALRREGIYLSTAAMPLPLAQLLLPRAFLSASGGFLQVAAAAACGAQQLHVRYVAGGGPTAEQQQGSDQQQQQQPGSSHDDQGMRMQLLQRALGHVKQQGWTHAALVAAARDLQLSPAVTGILPRCAP